MSFYRTRKPIPGEGGLRREQIRPVGWWSKRWLETLEWLLDAGRLRRGERYVRSGQVLEVTIVPGEVRGRVQGSRAKPYDVTIRSEPLSDAQWGRVLRLLSGKALFAANLLAGEAPREIEAAFEEAGAPLLPVFAHQVEVECSCPDWARVCKHGAALAYLAADRFDRDPFELFLLRGRGREDILASLGSGRGARESADEEGEGVDEPRARVLSGELPTFWTGGELPDIPEPEPPRVQAPLLRRLGPLAGEDLTVPLGPAYLRMSELALSLWERLRTELEGDQ